MIGYKNGSFNKKEITAIAAVMLTVALLIPIFIFTKNIVYADSTQGIVTTNDVNFRSSPWGDIIGQADYGDIVTILGEEDEWYHVILDNREGYLYAEYVAVVTDVTDEDFEASISEFPDDYKEKLRLLHTIYPNYIFEADFIDTDFNTLINAQWRKTINKGAGNSWKALYSGNYNWSTGEFTYREGGYTYASKEIIAYYADPRNWITSDEIYTFLRQSATGDETEEELSKIIAGTFLEGTYTPKTWNEGDLACGGSYAKVIMKAAEVSGVSPYVIASTIIQEQGRQGCAMCSGTYSGFGGIYYGYYNFYNINATGTSNDDVYENGLGYAKEHGWDNVYDAIVEGATWYASGYISQNQDTCYYKDFNVVNGPDYYWHQYSTAVFDHQNIGWILGNSLSENRDAAWTFRIPVYKNMPETAAEEPEENDNLNNYYFWNLEITGLDLEFDMYNNSYDISINRNITIRYTLPSGATYIGQDYYDVPAGASTLSLTVKAQTGYTRNYYITVNAASACRVYVNESSKGDVKEEQETKSGDEPSTEPAEEPGYTLGDPNGDGVTNVIDLALIKRYMLGKVTLSGDSFNAADINQDGKVNVIDLASVKKYILGKITTFE